MPLPLIASVPSQDKLDVTQKTRANMFNWRGQFTPEFVEHLLDIYSTADDVVADPFAGSGTVLLESVRKGMRCQGLEINPGAYAMSRFYTLCNMEMEQRIKVMRKLEGCLTRAIYLFNLHCVVGTDQIFQEKERLLAAFARQFFLLLETGIEKTLALNILFVSENQKRCNLETSLFGSFNFLKAAAMNLPYTDCLISVGLNDARTLHLSKVRPSIIVTSPPYINVFNYHQNHRAILEAVGWNMLCVAPSEFGSNRKNRGNRFKTIIQYVLDMDQALRSFWQSLQDNGVLILVIGRESCVRGLPFYNGQIIREVTDSIGAFDTVARHERKFLNKFGEVIKEDIFVFKKNKVPPHTLDVRQIAIKHLSTAFPSASTDIQQDIAEAIISCQAVHPSPLFDVKKAFSFA